MSDDLTLDQIALTLFAAQLAAPGATISIHGDLGPGDKEIERCFMIAETFQKVVEKRHQKVLDERGTETLTWYDNTGRRVVWTLPKGTLPEGMSDQTRGVTYDETVAKFDMVAVLDAEKALNKAIFTALVSETETEHMQALKKAWQGWRVARRID